MSRTGEPQGALRGSVGYWVAFGIILATMLALGVHRVALEFHVLQLGYAKADLALQNQQERERKERMEVEIAATKDLQRLTDLAERHHQMQFPRRHDRVRVQEPEDSR